MKKHIKRLVASVLLAAAAIGASSSIALAETAQETLDNMVSAIVSGDVSSDVFDYAEGQTAGGKGLKLKSTTTYPSSYDLRKEGYVTPVKFQNPWSTCWAFGITAASETSILSELGMTATEFKKEYGEEMDLSERHLAWFAKNGLPYEGEEGDSGNTQAGEGLHYFTSVGDESMNTGLPYYGTSVYASGMGAVKESVAPYQGKKGKVTTTDGETYSSVKAAKSYNCTPWYYSANDDWSLPESLRFYQSVALEESNILPDAAADYDKTSGTYTLDQDGINAVKEQVQAGCAVNIAYTADTSSPAQKASANTSRYINTKTWAQFTWANEDGTTPSINHTVVIVGWDDDYSASNFTLSQNPAKWDKYKHVIYMKDGVELENDSSGNPLDPATGKKLDKSKLTVARESTNRSTPPGNGAWICKNSWGSASQAFPNKNDWGDNGYFYLSYYDTSVSHLETFDFAVTAAERDEYDYGIVHQYDYMPTTTARDYTSYSDAPTLMCNVFAAGEDEEINCLSCETTRPYTMVNFELVLLDENPTCPSDGVEVVNAYQTYRYGGYHRIDLETPVKISKGQQFAVIVTETYEVTGDDAYTINFNLAADNKTTAALNGYNSSSPNGSNFYVEGVVNPGESYIGVIDPEENIVAWRDWSEVISNMVPTNPNYSQYSFDNFSIKAYANPIMKKNGLVLKTSVKTVKNNKKRTFKIVTGGANGKVTFTSTSKKVKVAKSGKVTVPKGTKPGKYKIKVRAAGNSTHNPATKTFTVIVKK